MKKKNRSIIFVTDTLELGQMVNAIRQKEWI
jgi:hypothetical protein